VDQHIRRLRKVLKKHGGNHKVIATVRGFGYQFTVDE
jgi:DNA-binding response OmpR family regulator